MCVLKEELKVLQNERSRLQQEADTRVLAKSVTMAPSTASEGPRPLNMEVARPPKEQRSSGEVSRNVDELFGGYVVGFLAGHGTV